MLTTEDLQSDPYVVLGVSPLANDADVKAAFKRQAARSHPDKGGNSEAFIRLSNAYRILSDPVKRAEYDAIVTSQSWYRQDVTGSTTGRGAAYRSNEGPVPGTFYADVDLRGRDRRRTVTVTLEELMQSKVVLVSHKGSVEPEGIRLARSLVDGDVLRVRSHGYPGVLGGSAGDLLLTVHVRQHPIFVRKGKHDIEIEVPIGRSELVAGTTIKVPGWVRNYKVKIAAGSAEEGTVLYVKGGGLPGKAGGFFGKDTKRGDLHVKLYVIDEAQGVQAINLRKRFVVLRAELRKLYE